MDPTRVSLTALGASVMRAVHTGLDHPALIDDPWGDRLISDGRIRQRPALLRLLARRDGVPPP